MTKSVFFTFSVTLTLTFDLFRHFFKIRCALHGCLHMRTPKAVTLRRTVLCIFTNTKNPYLLAWEKFPDFSVTLTFDRCQPNFGCDYCGPVLLPRKIRWTIDVKLLTPETDKKSPMLRDRDFPDFGIFLWPWPWIDFDQIWMVPVSAMYLLVEKKLGRNVRNCDLYRLHKKTKKQKNKQMKALVRVILAEN